MRLGNSPLGNTQLATVQPFPAHYVACLFNLVTHPVLGDIACLFITYQVGGSDYGALV